MCCVEECVCVFVSCFTCWLANSAVGTRTAMAVSHSVLGLWSTIHTRMAVRCSQQVCQQQHYQPHHQPLVHGGGVLLVVTACRGVLLCMFVVVQAALCGTAGGVTCFSLTGIESSLCWKSTHPSPTGVGEHRKDWVCGEGWVAGERRSKARRVCV